MSEAVSRSKRKSNTPWKHVATQTRREAAEARQAERNKRSDEEQLKHLDGLGLRALKERAKLALRIATRAARDIEKALSKEEKKAEKPKQEKTSKKGK